MSNLLTKREAIASQLLGVLLHHNEKAFSSGYSDKTLADRAVALTDTLLARLEAQDAPPTLALVPAPPAFSYDERRLMAGGWFCNPFESPRMWTTKDRQNLGLLALTLKDAVAVSSGRAPFFGPPENEAMPPDAGAFCHAGQDGDCIWAGCPQTKDNEPHATGRHCPLDNRDEES